MWFYYLARSYIDVGMEAIHFGHVALIGRNDPGHRHWLDLLTRCREYGRRAARRHLLLCDAHTPHGGPVIDGATLFDFHSFPLRIKDVVDQPQQGVLDVGFSDSLFGRSRGGRTLSGWTWYFANTRWAACPDGFSQEETIKAIWAAAR